MLLIPARSLLMTTTTTSNRRSRHLTSMKLLQNTLSTSYVKKVFDHHGKNIGTALALLEPMITSAWKPRMLVSLATTDEDHPARRELAI